MKRNFLLLFLMALLPLAGWAQPKSLAGYQIYFGDDDDAEYAYYANADVKPTIKLTKSESPDITSSEVNVVWTKDGETVTEIKNFGEYVVTVSANGSDTYGSMTESSRSFWVLTANNAVTNSPAVIGTKAYNASGYNLITTAPTVNFGTVKYLVTETETVPSANAEGWSTTARATKVGTHYVYMKVDADGTNNFKAIAPKKLCESNSVTITGTALTASDYTVPTELAAAINFDNADHALANAGTAIQHCTLKYSLDQTNWQETVPTGKNVCDYTVYWKAEGAAGYADATGSVTASIVAAAPVITAAPAATTTLTYTGKNQALLSGAGSATIGATPKYTIQYKATESDSWGEAGAEIANYSNVKGKNAGFYLVTTQVATGGNYAASTPKTTQVEIKKAPVTVTAEAKTKEYGTTTDPTLTAKYNGFQNNETTATAAGFTAATWSRAAGENVNEYAISKTGDASADNYTFTYDEAHYGKFTITPKELNDVDFTFTLATGDLEYTGEPLTKTIETAQFDDDDLSSPTDYTFVYTNNTNAGTANVVISGQGNFKGSLIRTFTIKKKQVYIKPGNASKNYGGVDPSLTSYTLVDGSGNAVEGAVLNGTVELARVAGENVSTYKIYVKSYTDPTPDNDNYTIADDQVTDDPDDATDKNLLGSFTINPAGDGLVLKFKAGTVATKVYGDTDPTYTIDDLEYVSGFVGDDDWATVKPTLSAPVFTIVSQNVDAADNKVTVTGLASTNYPKVTVQPLTFSVTKRSIAIIVKAQTIAYGAPLAQDAEHADDNEWAIDDTNSHGADWNGNSSDELSTLNVVLSTEADKDTYLAGPTHTGVIKATIDNGNYQLDEAKSTWGNLTVTPSDDVILFRSTTGSNANVITAYAGKNTGTVKIKGDALKANYWYTLVLPFKAKVRDISTAFGYAVVDVPDLANTTEKNVSFKLKVDNEYIDANTLIMIKIDQDKDLTASPASFTLTTATPIENNATKAIVDQAGNKYYVTYDAKELDFTADANCWYLYEDPSQDYKYNKYYRAGARTSNWGLASLTGYFDAVAGADARVFIQEADGTITAISTAEIDVKATNAEGWYTINGVKLNAAPTQKGIYIQNGKKVIVK